MAQTCENCKFWKRSAPYRNEAGTLVVPVEGLCMRYPPQMTMANVHVKAVETIPGVDGEPTEKVRETAFSSSWQFPLMMDFGWCGEWKVKGRRNG